MREAPVHLHFEDGSVVDADHVIITVSLGLLKAGTGQGSVKCKLNALFLPPLPPYKMRKMWSRQPFLYKKCRCRVPRKKEKAQKKKILTATERRNHGRGDVSVNPQDPQDRQPSSQYLEEAILDLCGEVPIRFRMFSGRFFIKIRSSAPTTAVSVDILLRGDPLLWSLGISAAATAFSEAVAFVLGSMSEFPGGARVIYE